MIDFKELIKAGVHFGHQRTRWCPKMESYIWGHRNGVHLIDVSKTAHGLDKAAKFLADVAAQGKQILWVGTKPAAKTAVTEVAKKLNMPYVNHRWIGGLLTNYTQVKKSVTNLLYYEDVLSKTEDTHYTKKEINNLQKLVNKLNNNIGGIRKISWPVGAIVVVDVKKEDTVIKEAKQSGIPVVAMVDTNCDPSNISYVIPANDDSPKSISLVLEYLAQAVTQAKEKAAHKKAEAAAERAELAAKEDQAEILIDEDIEEGEWENNTKTTKKPVKKKAFEKSKKD